MQGIIEFFQAISEPVVNALSWLTDFLADLAYVVALVTNFVIKIPSYFSWLPASCLAVIVIAFSVVVVYKIVGREG